MLEEAAPSDPTLNVILDTKPLQDPDQDPFIVHKTTFRDIYNAARERTACEWHPTQDQPFDVVLWNNKEQVTETSIANIAVRVPENGNLVWKTPKVECGMLNKRFK
jgi:branched-subunit amino acid aminotransferase/4-amino-4-deoxychorismate lyase